MKRKKKKKKTKERKKKEEIKGWGGGEGGVAFSQGYISFNRIMLCIHSLHPIVMVEVIRNFGCTITEDSVLSTKLFSSPTTSYRPDGHMLYCVE